MNGSNGPGVLETYTGRWISMLDPRPDQIDLKDIAWSLSDHPRHAGHCLRHYKVAQHCCLVHDWLRRCRHVEEVCFAGLLHDAAEAYLCDLPSPVKHLPGMAIYRHLEAGLLAAIYAKFQVEMPPSVQRAVKEADHIVLLAEIRQLKRSHGSYCDLGPLGGLEPAIEVWRPYTARQEFLCRFRQHRPDLACTPGS